MSDVMMMNVLKIKKHKDWPYRNDVGYLDGLCRSMSKPHGQLQPIGVDADGHLIWGYRRWRAAQKLGWTQILVRVVDMDDPLVAMKEENENRQGLSPSELTALMRAIEASEAKKASARMKAGEPCGNISTGSDAGKTRDKVASQFGVSGKTYDAMKKIDEHGTDALKEAVDEEVISISDAAKIVDEPPEVQDAAVDDVKAGKSKTASAAVRKSDADETVKDAEDHEVPKSCHAVFANIAEWKAVDSLCQQLQKAIDSLSRAPGGEQLAVLLKPTGSEDKTVNRSEHLNALKRDLKGTRPHSVCPYCEGKAKAKCKGCMGRGWVTKTTWEGAEDAVKARLA